MLLKELPDQKQYPDESVYGFFKDDKITLVGTSTSVFEGSRWRLRDITILPQYQNKGYGSDLLELTCEKLWRIKIFLLHLWQYIS